MSAALCVVVKDEVRDLAENIIHHLNIGFDRILLYDNGSTDGTVELASELALILPIDFIRWPTEPSVNGQVTAYNECIKCYRNCYDWIAFFDVDEFLVPVGDGHFADFLEEFDSESGVAINWMMFGSNSRTIPDDSMMSDYTRRAPDFFIPNRNVKSIVKPSHVIKPCDNPHWFSLSGPLVNLHHELVIWSPDQPGIVNVDRIIQGNWRLHHYYTRSQWHWKRRVARGQAGGGKLGWQTFHDHDRNDIFDPAAIRFANAVKSRIAELGLESLLRNFYPDIDSAI